MKVYFKNKLGVTTTVELEKNNTIEEFVSKIQDNGGIEKVTVTAYLSVFSPNAGKFGPEKTPYLDTFHRVSQYDYFLV